MKNKLKQGILRRNAKGFGFVKIEDEEKEYHISEKNLKNALNGDEVVIKIVEKSKKNNLQDEAKVVSIIKHERNTIVGTYQSNKNFGFVVPDDLSFGTDIFISKKNRNKAKNNQKVVVKITKYPEKNKNAEGKIIEIIELKPVMNNLGDMNSLFATKISVCLYFISPIKLSSSKLRKPKRLLGFPLNLIFSNRTSKAVGSL